MKDKKDLAALSIILGGLLIILWGMLHILIISTVSLELTEANVDEGIISLITLSYLGVVVMISLSGVIVILSAIYGIRKGEKWASYLCLSQGLLFTFVTVLLMTLQPRVSIMSFPEDFILVLAILTDLGISILILIPLLIWRKELL